MEFGVASYEDADVQNRDLPNVPSAGLGRSVI